MVHRVYVDGQSGTTGLEIHQRLAGFSDIEILELPQSERKDPVKKAEMMNQADLVFLCLPDDAARESVALITNPATRVVDASTAHRVAEGWVYGLPELAPGHRDLIRSSTRVAVTGCHAAAAILALRPLTDAGLLSESAALCLQSFTGYSGGGKAMIAQYEQEHTQELKSPRPYALQLRHKHLPEIQRHAGLTTAPVFMPVVGDFYRGLTVSIPLHEQMLEGQSDISAVHDCLMSRYRDEPAVRVQPLNDDQDLYHGAYNVQACNLTNRVDISVHGDAGRLVILSRLDNLGKGASGAAIQCMNLMLNRPEFDGLTL